MFSDEFVRLARCVLDERDAVGAAGAPGVLLRPDGAGPPSGLRALRRAGAVHDVRRGRGPSATGLRCPAASSERPLVCAACGRLRMKTLRAGVSRLGRKWPPSRRRGGRGVRSGEARRPCPRFPTPGPHRHRGGAAPGPSCRRRGVPRYRSPSARTALQRHRRNPGPVGPCLPHGRTAARPGIGACPRPDPGARSPGCWRWRGGSRRMSSRRGVDARGAPRLPPFSALASVSGPLANGYVAALRSGRGRGRRGRRVTFSELPEPVSRPGSGPRRRSATSLTSVPRPPGARLRVEVDPSAI